jgi:pyruvate/2-oxoglutarate/acetoin dehydrogenase E1 component
MPAAEVGSSSAPRNVRTDLNQALRATLGTSPKVVPLGEDMHDPYSGAFKVAERSLQGRCRLEHRIF